MYIKHSSVTIIKCLSAMYKVQKIEINFFFTIDKTWSRLDKFYYFYFYLVKKKDILDTFIKFKMIYFI